MGLSFNSTGHSVLSKSLSLSKKSPNDRIIALAGNPNVGKSTVFNALTGMRQHTGNWPGKTVEIAGGEYIFHRTNYIIVDIPGTYSFNANSPEEEIARNFIMSGIPDATVVVCDGVCLERSLSLALKAMEVTDNVVVCINLMDEAEKKGIYIDTKKLSEKLSVPVVGICAKNKKNLNNLLSAIEKVSETGNPKVYEIRYSRPVEEAVNLMKKSGISRKKALLLLKGEEKPENEKDSSALSNAFELLSENGIDRNRLCDIMSSSALLCAEELCLDTVFFSDSKYQKTSLNVDRIVTGRFWSIPIMISMLIFILWLTVFGANLPSNALSAFFSVIEEKLLVATQKLSFPDFLSQMLICGMGRCLFWVVSVMLPPMAIFFPLFTLLEDIGLLPRIAFNLDHIFKKCKTCGKQALTMCMGLGCNSAGVTGCRIINSPRERLIAVITNSLMPCNGRFPTIISVMTIFFAGKVSGTLSSVMSAVFLSGAVILGVILTFILSLFLSKTFLRGEKSSFYMELPPYRIPLFGKVLVRSFFDRTLFVLGRAVTVAAPAGLLIWILANVSIENSSLLSIISSFFDPLGRLMGLDGVMVTAFILGFPANEIVMPIAVMAYMAEGTLMEISDFASLGALLSANNWTFVTALCTVIFSLFHFPCSTTCLTIYKETKSIKWTALSIVLPTALGMSLCILINFICFIFIS